MTEIAVAYGRSSGHTGPVRRGYAYRGETARRVHPQADRPQRHYLPPAPRLPGMLDRAPRAAAILVAATLAIDLVRLLLTQPVG